MLKSLKTKRGGFTLVEIMIVVAIIALLASIAVPSFLRARKRSQATKILEEARIIDAAIDQYAIETSKSAGNRPDFNDLQPYFKVGSRLHTSGAFNDILGGTYAPIEVDAALQVDPVTKNNMSDVCDAAFWAPY
jgi:prepilin-type N-terminal cleavage/methylation domain-containing protein